MQSALDDVAFQNAVAEIGHGMGTMCLGGIEAPFYVVDGDALVPHLETLDAAGRNIGGGPNRNRSFCHGWPMPSRDKCFSGGREKFNKGLPDPQGTDRVAEVDALCTPRDVV